jgi:hypothetical protein
MGGRVLLRRLIRTMRLLGPLLPLSMALIFAAADRLTLEGGVLDRGTRQHLPGVELTLIVAGRTTQTNELGLFTFGEYDVTTADTLLVRHPGYVLARIPLGAPGAAPWTIDIMLEREVAPADSVPSRG